MAALTQTAVDALLGLLKVASRDEVQLMGGVHRDMKFIKDEMDSMNGFLLHLNKVEGEHDDLVRAWMKQVREVAEDLVERYVRDARHGARLGNGWCGGCLAVTGLFLFHTKTYFKLRELDKQIKELKTRVLEVGERRLRYDIKVHAGREAKKVPKKLSAQEEQRREAFVHALEEDVGGSAVPAAGRLGLLGGSMAMLASFILKKCCPGAPEAEAGLGLLGGSMAMLASFILKKCRPGAPEAGLGLPGGSMATLATFIILEKCRPGAPEAEAEAEARAFRCTTKMFLCALYVYPYPEDLKKLQEGVKAAGVGAQEARNQVMVFCYSLLSTEQKKCLLYLTAYFNEPEMMSRASMVRRWVAERCVDKEPGEEGSTAEEAGERCFRELLLRGFVRAARRSDTGTVKSCVVDDPVKDFLVGITKSENFLVDLPAHLERQRQIRSIVQLSASTSKTQSQLHCCGAGTDDDHDTTTTTTKSHMDELVDFIKQLPEIYRLNVLELGGGKNLESRHLKSFGKVEWLKYLSLRNTDVSRLHAKDINKLNLLQTLDIRGTEIPPLDTKKINLPKLKHLLADAAHMPDNIGLMRCMETLYHFQVSLGGAELQGVAKLQQLRMLGVIVHNNTTTAKLLGKALSVLAGSLRSLSVWVVGGSTNDILNIPSCEYKIHDTLIRVLENLDIKGKMSLPSWIGTALKLANVTLRHTEMDGRLALERLATIRNLRCLRLSRKAVVTQQGLRFEGVQFQALRILVVDRGAFTVFFTDDAAAPELEKITWAIEGGNNNTEQTLIDGIQHLPRLKEIELRASFKEEHLLELASTQTTPANPRYSIRYISSSTDRKQITELRKAATDTTLTLPAGVIN